MIAIVTAFPVSAIAQNQDPRLCSSPPGAISPDQRISACTALIQSGRLDTKGLVYAFTDRCQGYLDKRQYDLAIEDCDEAIRLDPNCTKAYACTKAYFYRGKAYAGKGQYDRAIEDFDEAIRTNPHYADAYRQRGDAKRRKGDIAGGDADIAAGRKMEPW